MSKLLNYLRNIFGKNHLTVIKEKEEEPLAITDILNCPILEEINTIVANGTIDSFPLVQIDGDSIKMTKIKIPELENMHNQVCVSKEEKDALHSIGIDPAEATYNTMKSCLEKSISSQVIDAIIMLGWKNHVNAWNSEQISLNLSKDPKKITPAFYDGVNFTAMHYDTCTLTDDRHLNTKKILSHILAAANYITHTYKLSGPRFVIMNMSMVNMLCEDGSYGFAPSTNYPPTIGQAYLAGHLCGMNVYVDPLRDPNNNLITVGAHSSQNDAPGIYGFFEPDITYSEKRTKTSTTYNEDFYCKLTTEGDHPEYCYFTLYVDL